MIRTVRKFAARLFDRPPARHRRMRLGVEELGSRWCPAVEVFTNGGGDMLWSNPANWDPAQVPGPNDDVLLPIASIMDGNYTVASVTIPACEPPVPVQTLQGTLTITGSFTWAGQNIHLDGSIVLQNGATGWWADGKFYGADVDAGDPTTGTGTLQVNAGATLTIPLHESYGPGLYPGSILANSGTVNINWEDDQFGEGAFVVPQTAVVSNLPGGQINFGGLNGSNVHVVGPGPFYNNPGATIGVTGDHQADFSNLISGGTVSATNGGTAGIVGGSSVSGTVQVGANSTVNVQVPSAGTQVTLEDVTFTGAGAVNMTTTGGSIVVNGDVYLGANTTVDAVINGNGSGSVVTVQGGTTLTTTGVTTITEGLQVEVAANGTFYVDGGMLVIEDGSSVLNYGTFYWSNGQIVVDEHEPLDSTFVNYGTFDVQAIKKGATMLASDTGTGYVTFENYGTLVVPSAPTADGIDYYLPFFFSPSGTVQVGQGATLYDWWGNPYEETPGC